MGEECNINQHTFGGRPFIRPLGAPTNQLDNAYDVCAPLAWRWADKEPSPAPCPSLSTSPSIDKTRPITARLSSADPSETVRVCFLRPSGRDCTLVSVSPCAMLSLDAVFSARALGDAGTDNVVVAVELSGNSWMVSSVYPPASSASSMLSSAPSLSSQALSPVVDPTDDSRCNRRRGDFGLVADVDGCSQSVSLSPVTSPPSAPGIIPSSALARAMRVASTGSGKRCAVLSRTEYDLRLRKRAAFIVRLSISSTMGGAAVASAGGPSMDPAATSALNPSQSRARSPRHLSRRAGDLKWMR
eukprot:Opistho-2@89207